MTEKSILVPIDFSEISQKVVNTAIYLAVRMKRDITLLHVKNGKNTTDPYARLKELSFLANEEAVRPHFDFLVKEGNLFDVVKKESRNEKYGLMVIGSHGFKGMREKIFGADILKLLKGISIPALIIQEEFELSSHAFERILFPAGSHPTFRHQIEATIDLAAAFKAEVILYTVEKPGLSFTEELLENIKLAESEFMRKAINFNRVTEVMDTYSVGYAKQIMEYAVREEVDLITMMANSTQEHQYIADADKVNILTNASRIPVLSGNDKIRVY